MFFSMRLVQHLLVEVVQHHVIAGKGKDMGNASPHLSGADHSNAFNGHVRCLYL